MPVDRYTCAICQCHIKPGLLMCFRHWRLVPVALQRQVLVAYGRMTRASSFREELDTLRAAYTTVRDEAVAIVNQTLDKQRSQPV